MYDYIAVRIDAVPTDEGREKVEITDVTDLLAAFLADEGFETFVPDENGLTAYIRKDKFEADKIKEILEDFPMAVNLSVNTEEIEGEDWNKEWEQNYFKPISIDGRLLIRSSFHDDYPASDIEIIIDPKMAFGTGHHSTTAGMSRMLLETDVAGKSVIDMGTGTGILAILAKKLGAGETTGIDIDEFAVENAQENGELNGVNVRWLTGDDARLKELEAADLFLANINLNVITENLSKYVAKTRKGGSIFLSGFLTGDRDRIIEEATKNGLALGREKEEKGWMTMEFIV